jgi:osmotically inducible protein OsmC
MPRPAARRFTGSVIVVPPFRRDHRAASLKIAPDHDARPTSSMNTLFTAEAISKGGRSGTLQGSDRLWYVTLGNPLEKGIEARGPTPELLFAGAYSACFHSALTGAAEKLGMSAGDSTVRALVSLIEEAQGGYRIAVELHAHLPGLDHARVQRIMEEAHRTCPYSKALRGDISVGLHAD